MDIKDKLIFEMIEYEKGISKRIQHLLKVHQFARIIGLAENITPEEMFIIETAAIIHDIGIKTANEKFGESNGKLQEQEGPPIAEKVLKKLDYDKDVINRVSFLVGHHHTYDNISGLDYQILVEADFLVNLYDNKVSNDGILTAYNNIFKTETGKLICKKMFALEV